MDEVRSITRLKCFRLNEQHSSHDVSCGDASSADGGVASSVSGGASSVDGGGASSDGGGDASGGGASNKASCGIAFCSTSWGGDTSSCGTSRGGDISFCNNASGASCHHRHRRPALRRQLSPPQLPQMFHR